MMKTFRGFIKDQEMQRIHLSGGAPDTGFIVRKFKIIAELPGQQNYENVVKIFKTKQSAVTGEIKFDDDSLLAAAYWESNSGAGSLPFYQFEVFDNEIVTQDLFITNLDVGGNGLNMSWYVELEEVKLKDAELAYVNARQASFNKS